MARVLQQAATMSRLSLLFATSLLAVVVSACGGRVDGIPSSGSLEPSGSGAGAAAGSSGSSGSSGTDTGYCRAIPTCDAGDAKFASESDCPQDDAACYSRTTCGQTIWCSKEAKCKALPICPPGSQAVKQCSPNTACSDVTLCGQTIHCLEWCEGPQPICDPGDTQVASPSQCLQDDAVCYSRTTCNHTIWCTGAP